ncbi:MAG: gluconolactonase, partial [Verrucomicrobiae bacterium]|nr:gluconolactonase [Verrucomicrobiae bacterium]
MIRISLCSILIFATAPVVARGQDDYKPGPDAERKDGVPQGTVTQSKWTSRIFDGTERDMWVYVPAQYDGSKPACVMVFFDGGGFVSEKGAFRAPIVFDNLIHVGEMP